VVQTTNKSKGKGSAQWDPLPLNTLNTLTTPKTQTRASDDETRTRVTEVASKRKRPQQTPTSSPTTTPSTPNKAPYKTNTQ